MNDTELYDKLSDLSDEAIKAMDLYWEPDIERIKHYLAVAYERGVAKATEVRA